MADAKTLLKQLAVLTKQVTALTTAKSVAKKTQARVRPKKQGRRRASKKEPAPRKPSRITQLAGFGKGEGSYIVIVGKSLDDHRQVFAIRAKDKRGAIGPAVLYAEAYWESPTKVVAGKPLPDTEGITCWMETPGPIYCHSPRTREGGPA